ncbi:hypothetical protein BTH42_31895 [Burkholderia sp. SRS-W-2-2016]|uniref:hypothetical protein n=1 Tax=Burkholderia sp. SRS-W-2-2016 TaxID=1926878 RepID=UPI00094AD285|nr:hypothetical protein [Burkholderia sp. SRS-W-2-2016]OLL27451.1 hypothetical protein BTH42_31895 [Burkholderia sp. SRS-W-2-2016]
MVSLFARMQATFGARFTALWADADLNLVKRVWAEALVGVKSDDLRRAVVALAGEKRPPDLPRFLELCEPRPAAQRPENGIARLPRYERADPEIVEANLARMRELLAPLANRKPSPQWAFDMLLRSCGKNGAALTYEARRISIDAVVSLAGRAFYSNASPDLCAKYRAVFAAALHARGDALPSRVPGEDDEEPQEVTV